MPFIKCFGRSNENATCATRTPKQKTITAGAKINLLKASGFRLFSGMYIDSDINMTPNVVVITVTVSAMAFTGCHGP